MTATPHLVKIGSTWFDSAMIVSISVKAKENKVGVFFKDNGTTEILEIRPPDDETVHECANRLARAVNHARAGII